MPLVPDYPLLPGHFLPLNGPRNLLTQAGLRDPRTGEPVSEAVILGVSGGLGCGYILWQFKGHIGTVLTLGFTYRWNYGKEAPSQACERLGARHRWLETGSVKKAEAQLAEELAAGRAAVAWLDQVNLGYLRQPGHVEGCFGWHGVVCGREEGDWLVHDLGAHARRVSPEVLAAARKRIGSFKHRLLVVDAVDDRAIDWSAAVRAGVADCTRYLSEKSDSFSIPAIRKWARLVVDAKHEKGWRRVFAGGEGLASALLSTYANIALGLGDGTGLRGSYAGFCREGAALGDWPALEAVAEPWLVAARAWANVAEVALPGAGALGELRSLADRRRELLSAPVTDANEAELDQVSEGLHARLAALDRDYPEPEADREARLEGLSEALYAVVEAERAAVGAMAELA